MLATVLCRPTPGSSRHWFSGFRVSRGIPKWEGSTGEPFQSTTSIVRLLWPLMTKGVEGNSYS
jgi:hypothetical protein